MSWLVKRLDMKLYRDQFKPISRRVLYGRNCTSDGHIAKLALLPELDQPYAIIDELCWWEETVEPLSYPVTRRLEDWVLDLPETFRPRLVIDADLSHYRRETTATAPEVFARCESGTKRSKYGNSQNFFYAFDEHEFSKHGNESVPRRYNLRARDAPRERPQRVRLVVAPKSAGGKRKRGEDQGVSKPTEAAKRRKM